MRKVIISGNWKMNKTRNDLKEFVDIVKERDLSNVSEEVQIYAPSVLLPDLMELTKGINITIGAQNVHQELNGAFTGEISVPMIKSVGVSNTLIGHSERREYFNETDEIVNQKVLLCLENKVSVIMCVGESLEEREQGKFEDVIKKQITEGLKNVSKKDMENIVIAYEPIWAIGTGKTATAEDADKACGFVRACIEDVFSKEEANNVCIQYGGSVKPENVKEILSQENIDGVLVGGASLDADSYCKLLNK